MSGQADLNVYLNGPRTYVQGTQIIARSAEAVMGSGPRILRQATFGAITDRLVKMAPANQAKDLAGAQVGRGVFEDTEGTTSPVVWHAQDVAAPQADLAPHGNWTLTDNGDTHPLSAVFALADLEDGEDFLNALIQTIKSCHEALADDVTDIWFTGIRRANIPLGEFAAKSGVLTLTGDRLMGQNGEFQTIQRAYFEADTGSAIEAIVTFAFKSQTFTYVH